MASSYFKRLKDKYGTENITGRKYEKMVSEILAHNNEKIANAVVRLSNANYKDKIKKLSTKKSQLVKLPDLSDVLPKQSVFMIKGAEQGNIITDTLRSRLEKDLRSTLDAYKNKGFEIQSGKNAGKLNTNLINKFRESITGTFKSYTKKDPTIGMPTNIRNIAVTEIRTTVDAVKQNYQMEVLKKNPGSIIMKTWIHNRRLSKKPRATHMAMHGTELLLDEKFRVERDDDPGMFDLMITPHDKNAPPGQNIGCSCECIYKTVIIREL